MFQAPRSFVIALVFILASFAWGQKLDYHLDKDSNRLLYQSSAFAHGNRHGYEEGFHAGDEDFQLRRTGYLLKKIPKAQGYSPSFGDKANYLAGFETGFRAGYADSYSGRSFRLLRTTFTETAPATETSLKAIPVPPDFDFGVAAGYRAGYINLHSIADEPGLSESASWRCQQEKHTTGFCQGYGVGYMMGRVDNESVALLRKAEPTNLAKNLPSP